MTRNTCKIAEARVQFSKLPTRARAGEEIVTTKGREPYVRIVPPVASAKREESPLHHLRLPDDLFDDTGGERHRRGDRWYTDLDIRPCHWPRLELGPRRLPSEAAYTVAMERGVGRNDLQIMGQRLGDRHSIERIAVRPG